MLSTHVNQAIAHYLTVATVERLENSQALLKLNDTGEMVYWPLSHLPAHCVAGSQVSIRLGDEDALKQERNAIAHFVLEQLMQ